MIANDPRYIHPIDTEKLLAGMVPTVANAAHGVTSSHYMATICGVCKAPTPLTHRQIDFLHVCESCFENHKISHNVLPCPYKQPRSRKLPIKSKPLTITITQAQTNESIRHDKIFS